MDVHLKFVISLFKIVVSPFKIVDFLLKMVNFPYKIVDFPIKILNFPFKMCDFLLKIAIITQFLPNWTQLVDARLNEHFAALRNYLLFHDGEFAQHLSTALFNEVQISFIKIRINYN